MKIAYLILAQDNPQHCKQLIRALGSPDSTFFVHVDKRSVLDDFLIPGAANLHFEQNRLPIYWKEFSVVEATLRLMRTAIYTADRYDYLVLLSDSDYPLRSARYIYHFFAKLRGTEFINCYSMTNGKGKPLSRLTRYVPRSDQIQDPKRLSELQQQDISANRDYQSWLGDLQPYSGSPWWALTHTACQYILDFAEQEQKIVRFFENTLYPAEMFFQTILANSPFRDKIRGSLTYADWSAGGEQPALISEKHLTAFAADDFMQGLQLLFARKFPADSETLVAAMDEMIARKEAAIEINEREGDHARTWRSLQFEPDFFFPWRFYLDEYQEPLKRYGEVYPREFYVLDAQQLVYLPVPKAACSSIKAALAKAGGIVVAENQSIHFHPSWHIQKGDLNQAQSVYYKFSFVRNPFERLVSCYREKIMFTPTREHPDPVYNGYYFALPAHSSFADFAQRVAKIPDPLADNHFKSQYALLYNSGKPLVDFVGKVEQLDHEWKQIAGQYQLEPTLISSNVTKSKQGCYSDYRLYYNESLAKLVYERYRQDIEGFGYEAEYEQLLEFVRMHQQNAVPGFKQTKEYDFVNNSKSLVSVVIPCYNLGEYLPEAVESVRRQTCPPVELIIVNDGSTDEQTRQILQRYEHQAGITVYHKPNGGASSARNYGISRAHGDYILCLDADDVLLPDFLAETVAQLDAQPAAGVVSTYVESFGEQETIWRPNDYTPHALLTTNQICGGSLFRKLCWEQAGGYKEIKGWEDWELWITIIEENGWQWAVVPQPLYRYRRRSGSLSMAHGELGTEILRQIHSLHAGLYQQHFSAVLMALDAELKQTRDLLQQYRRDNKAQTATILHLKQVLQLAQQQTAPQRASPTTTKPPQAGQQPTGGPQGAATPTTQAQQQETARQELVQRIQAVAPQKLPARASVLVANQGDVRFLELGEREAQPFPQRADGSYAGYHSTNGPEVIEHLEALRSKGGEFLLIPRAGFWWLERCPDFAQYLERTYRRVLHQPDTCLLFDLRTQLERHTFSVVIATYNRADKLGKAIESIFQQNYPKDKYELIIVDNNSSDQTADVVQRYRKQSPVPFAYYVEKRTGLSYTRNLGIEKAQLEFVAQLDDDAIAVPDWLAAMDLVINQHHALVVGGRVEKYFDEGYTPPAWFNYRYLLHFFGVNYRDTGKKEKIFRVRYPLDLPGGNTAYARRLFAHFGGFRADLGRVGKALLAGEETFLNLILDRNEIPMYYSDDVCIYHHVGADRLNKQHLRKRAYWSGVTSAYMNALFFGYEETYAKTRSKWPELRRLIEVILKNRGSVENFSRTCQLLFLVAYLSKFYWEFAKYKLSRQKYTPPQQVTWTTLHWIEETAGWPESEEKYEQLYQLFLAAQDTEESRAKLAALLPSAGSKRSVDQWEPLRVPLRRLQSEWWLARLQAMVEQHTPLSARVAVISKGDEQLVQFNGRQGWHFPQDDAGEYAGYYPTDSTAAIAHLAQLSAKGADFLVLPSLSLWWLEHYAEFKQYLLQHGQVLVDQQDTCLIFALHKPMRQEQATGFLNKQPVAAR